MFISRQGGRYAKAAAPDDLFANGEHRPCRAFPDRYALVLKHLLDFSLTAGSGTVSITRPPVSDAQRLAGALDQPKGSVPVQYISHCSTGRRFRRPQVELQP